MASNRGHACARILGRYFPEAVLGREWYEGCASVFDLLDDPNSARLISAAMTDGCPTPRALDALAETLGLYAENGRRHVAQLRDDLLHPTTHREGHDAWKSERTAQSSTTA